MSASIKDKGIILTKRDFIKDDKLIIIFSETFGKLKLLAKNIKTITSKRISHIETGNYISFSYTNSSQFLYLHETELIYGYSKIKSEPAKIAQLYQVLFILNHLLPENQREEEMYKRTLQYLKELNNREVREEILLRYIKTILIQGGYITEGETEEEYFNPYKFIEELTQKKIQLNTI